MELKEFALEKLKKLKELRELREMWFWGVCFGGVKEIEGVKGVKRNVTLGVKGNDAEIRMDMLMAQSHFS